MEKFDEQHYRRLFEEEATEDGPDDPWHSLPLDTPEEVEEEREEDPDDLPTPPPRQWKPPIRENGQRIRSVCKSEPTCGVCYQPSSLCFCLQ